MQQWNDVPEQLGHKLYQAFSRQDLQGQGTIGRTRVAALLKRLDATFTDEEANVLIDRIDTGKSGVFEFEEFINHVLDVADELLLHMSNAFGCTADAALEVRYSSLGSIGELLSAEDVITTGVRQNILLAFGAVEHLLGIVLQGISADLTSQAVKILTALACGNETSAEAIATNDSFLPSLRKILCNTKGDGSRNLFLSVLLLVHAIGASPSHRVDEPLSCIVDDLAHLLHDDLEEPFVEAVLDVLALCALHCPNSVAKGVSWPVLASIVAEDSSRPAWLSRSPLQVLIGGLLVSSVLGGVEAEDEDRVAVQLTASSLMQGHFVENLLLALEAAASCKPWPAGSNAFHSVHQLATAVEAVAIHGCSRERRIGSVEPLAEVIMRLPAASTKLAAVHALRTLSEDVSCQRLLLQRGDSFRTALLHNTPDSKPSLQSAVMDLDLLLNQPPESASGTH